MHKTSPQGEGEVSLKALAVQAGWGEEHSQASPTPEDGAAQAENRLLLEKGLESLSPLHREIIVLRDLEQFSSPETAQLLGLGEEAVRARHHRARLKLMASMRGHGGHDGR
jgi:RNA polymerase sigma factor (sigma-70 family)